MEDHPLHDWVRSFPGSRLTGTLLAAGALPFSTGERSNVHGGFHIRRL